MATANISMDEWMLEEIDDEAEALDLIRSEWFREAARQKLGRQEASK